MQLSVEADSERQNVRDTELVMKLMEAQRGRQSAQDAQDYIRRREIRFPASNFTYTCTKMRQARPSGSIGDVALPRTGTNMHATVVLSSYNAPGGGGGPRTIRLTTSNALWKTEDGQVQWSSEDEDEDEDEDSPTRRERQYESAAAAASSQSPRGLLIIRLAGDNTDRPRSIERVGYASFTLDLSELNDSQSRGDLDIVINAGSWNMYESDDDDNAPSETVTPDLARGGGTFRVIGPRRFNAKIAVDEGFVKSIVSPHACSSSSSNPQQQGGGQITHFGYDCDPTLVADQERKKAVLDFTGCAMDTDSIRLLKGLQEDEMKYSIALRPNAIFSSSSAAAVEPRVPEPVELEMADIDEFVATSGYEGPPSPPPPGVDVVESRPIPAPLYAAPAPAQAQERSPGLSPSLDVRDDATTTTVDDSMADNITERDWNNEFNASRRREWEREKAMALSGDTSKHPPPMYIIRKHVYHRTHWEVTLSTKRTPQERVYHLCRGCGQLRGTAAGKETFLSSRVAPSAEEERSRSSKRQRLGSGGAATGARSRGQKRTRELSRFTSFGFSKAAAVDYDTEDRIFSEDRDKQGPDHRSVIWQSAPSLSTLAGSLRTLDGTFKVRFNEIVSSANDARTKEAYKKYAKMLKNGQCVVCVVCGELRSAGELSKAYNNARKHWHRVVWCPECGTKCTTMSKRGNAGERRGLEPILSHFANTHAIKTGTSKFNFKFCDPDFTTPPSIPDRSKLFETYMFMLKDVTARVCIIDNEYVIETRDRAGIIVGIPLNGDAKRKLRKNPKGGKGGGGATKHAGNAHRHYPLALDIMALSDELQDPRSPWGHTLIPKADINDPQAHRGCHKGVSADLRKAKFDAPCVCEHTSDESVTALNEHATEILEEEKRKRQREAEEEQKEDEMREQAVEEMELPPLPPPQWQVGGFGGRKQTPLRRRPGD